MGDSSSATDKLPFFRVLAYIIAIASVFWAGTVYQGRQDAAMIDLLKEKSTYYQSRVGDTLTTENFFANFELAQMSSIGEYRLLFGNSSLADTESPFSDSIVAAITAIKNNELSRAERTLGWAAIEMPEFPYTYFYLGICAESEMPKRARNSFATAHSRFAFLLKVRPNAAVMRLYDAMALTFLGHGDSATAQLYRVCKIDPAWRGLACDRLIIEYDTASLSIEERVAWSEFVAGINEVKCDTTRLSSGVRTVDHRSKIPKVHWPSGYEWLSQ